jgi:hypothetical protein
MTSGSDWNPESDVSPQAVGSSLKLPLTPMLMPKKRKPGFWEAGFHKHASTLTQVK